MGNRKDSKGRVLKDGETERGDGRYCYRYYGLDGKRKYIYDKDLSSLRDKERKINKDLEDGIYSNNITLNEAFERYMSVKTDLREGTRHKYNLEYNRWIRNTWIGNKCISEIKKSDILLFYKEKSQTLANGTIRCVHKYIHPTLEMAVEDDLIRKNPADNCIRDYMGSDAKLALTKEQTVKMLNFAENEYDYGKKYLLAVKIMLGTGLRVGETVGLTWNDIDLQNGIIHVNKQFTLIAGGGMHEYHISPVKTKSGIRDVPMSADVIKMLTEYKLKNYYNSVKYKVQVDGYSEFVFCTRTGLPILPNRINDYLEKMVKTYNDTHEDSLPKMSCHIMRHTFCTRMAELGINPSALQYIMGHSSYRTTADIYITETKDHAEEEFRRVIGG